MTEEKTFDDPQVGDEKAQVSDASNSTAGSAACGVYDDGMTRAQRVRMGIARDIAYSFGHNGISSTDALIHRIEAVHSFVMND